MEVKKRLFGYFMEEEVYEYTIINSNDLSLSVISYGGMITQIGMPDRNGEIEDITVHLDSLDEIIADRPFHGTIIGPVAGRITKGRYFDEGEKIQLEKNEKDRTLHGGSHGLDTKNWEVEVYESGDEITLVLETLHPDLESGFPGNIAVKVSYTLNEANDLIIDYEAMSDKKTVFSPSNHVYFNLSGNKEEKIYEHTFELASDYYAVIIKEGLLTGELRSVDHSDYDFREMKKLAFLLNSEEKGIMEHEGIDHPFLLNQKNKSSLAKLYHKKSGRQLEMKTDADAVVIYTHNHEQLSETKKLGQHSGIALETSGLPDAMNHENFPSIELNKNETFHSQTIFTLSIVDQ